jgi:hypothetical protein
VGTGKDTGLFALVVEAGAKELTGGLRVTRQVAGDQAIAAACGTRRAALLADGRAAIAWHGEGGLGDDCGAHLSWLRPADLELPARASSEARPLLETPSVAASPHEPPLRDPAARLSPETDLNSPLAGGDLDFLAVTSTGWTPPDPHMAVGMNHLVVMTNGEIAFFDKLGTNLFRDEIEDAFGFWGGQGATNFVFDPEVVWDPYEDRFIATSTGQRRFRCLPPPSPLRHLDPSPSSPPRPVIAPNSSPPRSAPPPTPQARTSG